jgi:hypothetical protein
VEEYRKMQRELMEKRKILEKQVKDRKKELQLRQVTKTVSPAHISVKLAPDNLPQKLPELSELGISMKIQNAKLVKDSEDSFAAKDSLNTANSTPIAEHFCNKLANEETIAITVLNHEKLLNSHNILDISDKKNFEEQKVDVTAQLPKLSQDNKLEHKNVDEEHVVNSKGILEHNQPQYSQPQNIIELQSPMINDDFIVVTHESNPKYIADVETSRIHNQSKNSEFPSSIKHSTLLDVSKPSRIQNQSENSEFPSSIKRSDVSKPKLRDALNNLQHFLDILKAQTQNNGRHAQFSNDRGLFTKEPIQTVGIDSIADFSRDLNTKAKEHKRKTDAAIVIQASFRKYKNRVTKKHLKKPLYAGGNEKILEIAGFKATVEIPKISKAGPQVVDDKLVDYMQTKSLLFNNFSLSNHSNISYPQPSSDMANIVAKFPYKTKDDEFAFWKVLSHKLAGTLIQQQRDLKQKDPIIQLDNKNQIPISQNSVEICTKVVEEPHLNCNKTDKTISNIVEDRKFELSSQLIGNTTKVINCSLDDKSNPIMNSDVILIENTTGIHVAEEPLHDATTKSGLGIKNLSKKKELKVEFRETENNFHLPIPNDVSLQKEMILTPDGTNVNGLARNESKNETRLDTFAISSFEDVRESMQHTNNEMKKSKNGLNSGLRQIEMDAIKMGIDEPLWDIDSSEDLSSRRTNQEFLTTTEPLPQNKIHSSSRPDQSFEDIVTVKIAAEIPQAIVGVNSNSVPLEDDYSDSFEEDLIEEGFTDKNKQPVYESKKDLMMRNPRIHPLSLGQEFDKFFNNFDMTTEMIGQIESLGRNRTEAMLKQQTESYRLLM